MKTDQNDKKKNDEAQKNESGQPALERLVVKKLNSSLACKLLVNSDKNACEFVAVLFHRIILFLIIPLAQ